MCWDIISWFNIHEATGGLTLKTTAANTNNIVELDEFSWKPTLLTYDYNNVIVTEMVYKRVVEAPRFRTAIYLIKHFHSLPRFVLSL